MKIDTMATTRAHLRKSNAVVLMMPVSTCREVYHCPQPSEHSRELPQKNVN